MYELTIRDHFDAAHSIARYPGKCQRKHGHTWEVETVWAGPKLNELNMLVDFVDMKSVTTNLFERDLDHYDLNETLREPQVTAEFLAEWIYRHLLRPEGVELRKVTVWESSKCGASYYEGK